MVFESLVADLVNRFLGDFIENLDKSQLSIGIWGGDVQLNNLYVKENLFDDLDLPIRVVYGNIGQLKLKIPWKNLYTEPTIALLDGLYIIAVPNSSIAYDEAKEQKAMWEAKQKELNKIEEAKKIEAEKYQPKDPKKDTFAEKLTANVIKNLEVKVTNIHVRYEDAFTNPKFPFSIGVTLKEVSCQTTDENWNVMTIKENASTIHKLLKLDSFSLYWNLVPTSYRNQDRSNIMTTLKNNIAVTTTTNNNNSINNNNSYDINSSRFHRINDYVYVVEPLTSIAKLKMNPKPEQDGFQLPKIIFSVVFEEICIALQKMQYQTLLEYLDSFERLTLSSKYRKYRPIVPRRNNAKIWWKFAMDCVMNELVLRRRRMWSWQVLKSHRELCRHYKKLYKQKLSTNKPSAELLKEIEKCEKELDVLNITIARKQAEMEAAKEGLNSSTTSKGWFSGWFGKSSKSSSSSSSSLDGDDKTMGDKVQELMTPEEKRKLYEAIGYQESADAVYPKEYVAISLILKLKKLRVQLVDTSVKSMNVLDLQLDNVETLVQQRPAADALRVVASMYRLSVRGQPAVVGQSPMKSSSSPPSSSSSSSSQPPLMITSDVCEATNHMLDLLFETNPLDGKCDTRVVLSAQPMKIIYHAATVISLADFFKPPESIHLMQLQAVAFAQLERMKEQTVAGLQYAIDQKKFTEVNIHVRPTRVLLPRYGVYTENCEMLVVDLGRLSIINENTRQLLPQTPTSSSSQSQDVVGEEEFFDSSATVTSRSLDEIKQTAYDLFNVKVQSLQVLFVNAGERWDVTPRSSALSSSGAPVAATTTTSIFLTSMYVLKPVDININLHKCLLEDVQLPKLRVIGELPSLTLSISDKRLVDIISLLASIPFPQSDEEDQLTNQNLEEEDPEMKTVDLKNFTIQEESTHEITKVIQKIPQADNIRKSLSEPVSNIHESTTIELKFEIKEISVLLSKLQEHNTEIPTLKVVVMSLGSSLIVKPFDSQVHLYLGGVYLQHTQFKAMNNESLINLVNTLNMADDQSHLLTIDVTMAQKKHPYFWSKFNGTLQKVNINVSDLELVVHQEAILNLMSFSHSIQQQLDERMEKKLEQQQQVAIKRHPSRVSLLSSFAASGIKKREPRTGVKKKSREVINTALFLSLENLILTISTDQKMLATIKTTGLEVTITMQRSMMCVESFLKDLVILNQDTDTCHHKIISFQGNHVFKAGVIIYNETSSSTSSSSPDMSVMLRTGCMNIVFLNGFVQGLLGFINQFEAAKNSLIEAGSAAKEKAAAAAQDLSQKATKISLDIEIDAPVIIVPRNRKSPHCLVVDLGLLKVNNKFKMVKAKVVDDVTATLDCMTVELTNVKLFRMSTLNDVIIASSSSSSSNVANIMDPLTIVVEVTRNLSSAWYHDCPDVEVNGKMKFFKTCIDQGDLKTVLLILSENLQEGSPPLPKQQQQQQTSATSPPKLTSPSMSQVSTAKSPQQPQQRLQQQDSRITQGTNVDDQQQQLQLLQPQQLTTSTDIKPEHKDVYTTFVAKFQIEKIQMKLYTGGLKEYEESPPLSQQQQLQQRMATSPLSPSSSTNLKQDSNLLAYLELESFVATANIMSDSSMQANVSLFSFQISDARVEKASGITKMLCQTVESFDKDMMVMLYKQDTMANKTVEMKLDHLEVVLCIEFLLKLSDFYTQSTLQSPPSSSSSSTSVRPSSSSPPSSPSAGKKVKSEERQQQAPETSVDQSEMVIHFEMSQSKVVLVEDAMNPDTNALLMEMSAEFSMRQSSGLQSMKALLNNLSIVSCIYSHQHDTKSHILAPVSINMQSSAPCGKNPHIALTMTDIDLYVSAASIRIITSTLSPLSAPKVETVEDQLNKIPKDLWTVKKLANCDYWFLRSSDVDNTAVKAEDFRADLHDSCVDLIRGEQLLLLSNRISVILLGGYGKLLQPLIATEINIKNLEVKDWSSKMRFLCDVDVQAAYYNERLASWEPIIEPVHDGHKYLPWSLNVMMEQNDAVYMDDDDVDSGQPSPPPARSVISVTTNDVMQITVTKTLLNVLKDLSQSFSDAYSLVAMPTTSDVLTVPYTVRNETGMYLTLRYGQSFKPITDKTTTPTTSPSATSNASNNKDGDKLRESECGLKPGDVVNFREEIVDDVPEPHVETTHHSDGSSIDGDDHHQQQQRQKQQQHLQRQYRQQLSQPHQQQHKVLFNSIYNKVNEEDYKMFTIFFNDLNVSRQLHVTRADKRAFTLDQRSQAGDPCYVIAHTKISYGRRTVTLKSVLKVTNKLPIAMGLLYKLGQNNTGKCGSVQPGENINLPCEVTYTAPYAIILKPCDENYNQSMEEINWNNQSHDRIIDCLGKEDDVPNIYVAVRVEYDMTYNELSDERTVKMYNVILSPSVVFKNLLPSIVACKTEGPGEGLKVESGQQVPLVYIKPGTTALSLFFTYQKKDWSSQQVIENYLNNKSDQPTKFGVWTFEAFDDGKRITMDLGIHMDLTNGHLELSLYSPYWLINLTNQNLSYKAADDYIMQHPSSYNEAVLMLLKRSNSAAAKVALKIGESDWSEKFSLDTAGSVGTVECVTRSNAAKVKESTKSIVGVKITLASNGLTKIITFTPHYMFANNSNFTILFKEHIPTSQWVEIQPNEVLPYWPVQTSAQKLLVACIKNSALETRPFSISDDHTTLLKLYHDYGGINAVCQRSESSTVVTFQQYFPGSASALIVNHTKDANVYYWQKDSMDSHLVLAAQQSVLYTWDDPVSKRELLWSLSETGKSVANDLSKDGIGEVLISNDRKLFWVSFLDGMQRVLLFTDDLIIATFAQQAGELEQLDQEITLSLHGFGLSFVNNHIGKEIAYMGITSSGVIWEQAKGKRFKALKLKHSTALETAYQNYKMELMVNKHANGKKVFSEKYEADFTDDSKMFMLRPHKVEIRRSFEYGVRLKYGTSKHSIKLHLKVHKMQLDNQLPGAIFPTVLAPVPPPKSVASESVPKPFLELSTIVRTSAHSNVKQFKYCKLLIQEMSVKVDQGFLNAILLLFTSAQLDDASVSKQELLAFKRECKVVDHTLVDEVITAGTGDAKNFYDMLHFSPLKIHLSFSLYGVDDDKEDEDGKMAAGGNGSRKKQQQPQQIQWKFLELFLQSVGVVLTDIQDVVFKLGYFERQFTFYSQSQLMNEITRHYSQQAIKQMYVLVLGLDVLGNPFGIVRGLAEGIETLFYEPYQGAIQGPEEFAEGLALGVRSLLGHAVGGAAGAVSRITGALGKGIATLTMDNEYQKKRREDMNKKPADLKEGFARGGKGLVMGVFDGVTGIVMKPVEGAKQEGVGGFFKGMGKGLVGAFTRPASGVVDFASSSFDSIRRVAEQTEDVPKLRAPRLIQNDGVVRPYVGHEAEGNQILRDIAKNQFTNDKYVGHLVVSDDKRNVFLVTDKNVLFVMKSDILGHWNVEWFYGWMQLKEAPSLTVRGIQIILKEREKKLIGSGSIGKNVNVYEKDRKYAEVLVGKIKSVMSAAALN